MFSNLDRNYFERVLGYELFTTKIQRIANALNIVIDRSIDLKILYGILANHYLNILDNKQYDVDLIPFFYLQLKNPYKFINKLPKQEVRSRLLTYFEKEIIIFNEQLFQLVNEIKTFQNECFKGEKKSKLIAFLRSMRFKEKPVWLTRLKSVYLKKKTISPLTPRLYELNVGESILVIRPYVIHNDGKWNIEKVPVFFNHRKPIAGKFYFDIFLIRIVDKYITIDNITVLKGESAYKGHQFIAEINFGKTTSSAIHKWEMSYIDKVTKEHIVEKVPFYELCDFQHINQTLRYPLSDYQLKCLIDDAKFQIATLG